MASAYMEKKLKPKKDLIISKILDGASLDDIGKILGMTRQGVAYFCKYHGIDTRLGIAVRRKNREENINQKRKSKADLQGLITYGVDSSILSKFSGDVRRKYRDQKCSANGRKIQWQMTIAEWWEVWMQSGKWQERGIGSGRYVMARHGDIGAYRVGNVEIITHNQNSSDCRKNTKDRKKKEML